nr:glycosyltransferase family 61 protein [Neoroseomonas eburnea]
MAAAPDLPEAALGVEPHGNFYHWVIDTLTSLAWRLDPGPEGMPVLLREDAPAYVRESLDIAAGAPVPTAEAGAAVLVRRLHLGDRGLRHLAPRGAHATLLGRFAEAARREAVPAAERLYISRRDSGIRRMLNEEEIEAVFAERGFVCTTFGGQPLLRQIGLLRGAQVIAGPHGAGFAHLLFCDPGRQVFELLPATLGHLDLRACFATLSRVCGHRHGIWLAPFNQTFGDWRVPAKPAAAALDRFLAGRAGT